MNKQKQRKKSKARKTTPKGLMLYKRLGLIGLLLLLVCFFIYGVTREPEQRALALLIYALPLTLPIRGMLHGKRYTMGYSTLMASVYFCFSASMFIFHEDWARYIMLVATCAAFLWFFACLIYNKKTK